MAPMSGLSINADSILLYKQTEDRSESESVHCTSPGYVPVLRSNMKPACVYPDTAQKFSLMPVTFTDDNMMMMMIANDLKSSEPHEKQIQFPILS